MVIKTQSYKEWLEKAFQAKEYYQKYEQKQFRLVLLPQQGGVYEAELQTDKSIDTLWIGETGKAKLGWVEFPEESEVDAALQKVSAKVKQRERREKLMEVIARAAGQKTESETAEIQDVELEDDSWVEQFPEVPWDTGSEDEQDKGGENGQGN